jgi:hypothetical protein
MKKKMRWIGIGVVMLAAGVFADLISFQQGDLRKDGNLIDSGYQTGSATLSSAASNTVQTSTSMYTGSSFASSTARYYRNLLAFDLSYIDTLANGSAYSITSIVLNLTISTVNASLPATTQFSILGTTAFNEADATWNTPGSGAPAGGTVGSPFASRNVSATTANTLGAVVSFNAADNGNMETAITNAMAGNKMLYVMVKQTTENGLASYFIRAADDDHATVDYRPELLVGLAVIPEPATIGMMGLGGLIAILIRRRMRA